MSTDVNRLEQRVIRIETRLVKYQEQNVMQSHDMILSMEAIAGGLVELTTLLREIEDA